MPAEMAVLACDLLRQVRHEPGPKGAALSIALGLSVIDLAKERDSRGEGFTHGHD